MDDKSAVLRIRREPPAFRRVTVDTVGPLSPFMSRITLTGSELEGLIIDEPAASVRLLLPPGSADTVVIPAWNGNEFLFDDGSRPTIRTFTPRRFDADACALDIDVVIHDGGAVSEWVRNARPGASAAVSGPGRGYVPDPSAEGFVLGGDETAIPAIGQLIETLPSPAPIRAYMEIRSDEARIDLPERPATETTWLVAPPGEPPGTALEGALRSVDIGDGTLLWVAGEAAAMHRIRRHLFEERGLSRKTATVRGYWKHGR